MLMRKGDLKIAIEEIVAPLPADPRLKDRYREELLGHLMALVEDEQAQGRDNVRILSVALERLGDPETLRTNFMDSLSRLDRAYVKAGEFFEKRSHESSLRFALRGAGVFALGMSLFIVTLFAPTIAGITWLKGPEPGVVVFLPVFGLFVLLYSVAIVFFALLIATRWEGARLEGKWGEFTLCGFFMVVLSILFGAVCMGIGHVLLASLLGNHHPEIYTFDAASGITVAGAIAGILASVGFIASGRTGEFVLRGRSYRRIPDWPYRIDS